MLRVPRICCRALSLQKPSVRFFSSSQILNNKSSTQHPSHPELHVHEASKSSPAPKLRYAISYVSSADIPASTSLLDHPDLIIGWTPEQFELNHNSFVENNSFVQFLTNTLSENIHKVNDPTLKATAQWQKEGWLHIGDERNPPPWGRIPFPEDIIGTVLVKDGEIQPGTYQAMPTHRIVSPNGVFQLSEPLARCVIEKARAKVQSS
ncbi:uncharacterized protein BYT42DRAFT_178118 [Radiomyces spectabilis]|uniref:uncharacterized protein n=1 Tax=Radiomyces spectabilis TaxID=64574 RepID=UPI00221E6C87|nr:uncharacterized protein BYT42DRAFT_178118 [Radiomyces spectabilis]KAI8390996.1 hypothetical protein BYT42DRAFT_178118 [Radiomyces spectabilis]